MIVLIAMLQHCGDVFAEDFPPVSRSGSRPPAPRHALTAAAAADSESDSDPDAPAFATAAPAAPATAAKSPRRYLLLPSVGWGIPNSHNSPNHFPN